MSKLTNYAKIILGGTPATNRPDFWDGGIPWVSVVDFTDSKKIYTTEKTITESGLSQSNTKLLNEGDIIISARGTVGKVAVCGKKMAFNQSCYALLTKGNNKLSQNYLFYLLQEKIKYLRQMAVGGVFNTIIKSTLEKIPVELPDISTQEKISDILSAYDDLIDTNRRRIQLLEDAARLLFCKWFVYFRFPGHEKVKIVDGVPEGWKKEKINRLVTFKRGVEPGSDNYLETYESGSFPFFRVSDLVTRNPSIFVDEQYAKSALLEKSDIVISLDGSVGIVSMGLEGCYSTGIRKLIIKDKKINRSYLYFLMKSHYIQGVINAYAKGTTIQHAGEAIKHMNSILPPQNLMDLFDEITSPAFNEVLILLDQNQKLAQARDLLLPRLMSGAIEVSESSIEISKEAET
ncbi:MAG: restriction endonuclease subunit S [Candidatus Marinimicrobia bacterium]|nr:restriction endonuclease subunit S [Candidatus Neomarinimicrobiota bacterium]